MRYLSAEVSCSLEEKKSRFIGHLLPLENSHELKAYLKEEQQNHPKARHICSAYILDNGTTGARDDGEPHGTAGRPMLSILKAYEISNCLALVVRYFGGTLLGTGGLVKAYSGVIKRCCEQASFYEKTPIREATLVFPYHYLDGLKAIFKEYNIIYELKFSENILAEVKIEAASYENFRARIRAIGLEIE